MPQKSLHGYIVFILVSDLDHFEVYKLITTYAGSTYLQYVPQEIVHERRNTKFVSNFKSTVPIVDIPLLIGRVSSILSNWGIKGKLNFIEHYNHFIEHFPL